MATITEALILFNQWGGFSYVIPFLLIFAVVFAILQKTKILGENRTIEAIVAIAIGMLALLNDHVPIFFSNIFPKFGIGLAVFLVLIILIGFFHTDEGKATSAIKWIGWVTGIGVVLWALTSWNYWTGLDDFGLGWWLREYFWSLIILAGIIVIIVVIAKSGKDKAVATTSKGKGQTH